MSSRRPAPITEEQSCITDWKNHFQRYAKHVGVVEMPPPPQACHYVQVPRQISYALYEVS